MSEVDEPGTRIRDAHSVWDPERLSFVLMASGLGDWSWDAESDVVIFSSRAAEIFGIPPGSSMTWTELRGLLHAEDREPARLAVERALEERSVYAIEYRLINGDRERWVSVRARGSYHADGRVLGMLGVVQDITSDRLLLRLDDSVRPLVNPEDITYTAALVLGQHLRVDRCAYAFVEPDQDTFTLTGNYTHGVKSIVGSYRFRQFGAECLRLMRAGLPYVVSDALADPRIDDTDREAYALTTIRAVICVPILKSGAFVAAMAVHMQTPRAWSAAEVALVQQVASRCWESIERARVERERERLLHVAEAANRAKDEFLAMLGHELRNPLAPIQTALDLMKLKEGSGCERERTVIERQVNHLTRLVDDLLDVSRIARGKIELKLEPIEIHEIVTRALELTSPLLEQQTHNVRVDVPRSGLLVYGDAARLTQVVSNLVSNAAKYTPSSGEICIAAQGGESTIELRVRDNGIGMPAEILEHVFELFVQGRQSLDRARGGLGLGLSIVRSFVERHGGSVTAQSQGLGRGSEFVVTLPRAPAAAPPAAEPSPEATVASGARGARVLIVDDNEDAAEMLAALLARRDCEVRVAHDGPSALAIARTLSFDAALLDIGLPVMDGYELAGRLRALPSFQHTYLVAITGYGQDADRRRALSAGFEEHLVKPVGPAALDALVARLHSRG